MPLLKVPANQRGLFVVLEGINGAGKSTIVNALKTLTDHHAVTPVRYQREPTNSPAGMRLRQGSNSVQDSYLDRQDHQSALLSLINSGIDVVCDRYALSCSALQFDDWKDGRAAYNYQMTVFLKPDLTVYVECPAEDAAKRLLDRQKVNPDIPEPQDKEALVSFLEDLDRKYRYLLFSEQMTRYRVVNGLCKPSYNAQRIFDWIKEYKRFR